MIYPYSLPPGSYQQANVFLPPGKRIVGTAGFTESVYVMLMDPGQFALFHAGQQYQTAGVTWGYSPGFDWMPPYPGSWKLVVWNTSESYVTGQMDLQVV